MRTRLFISFTMFFLLISAFFLMRQESREASFYVPPQSAETEAPPPVVPSPETTAVPPSPSQIYHEAAALFRQRKFEEAHQLFSELGEYADSTQLAAYAEYCTENDFSNIIPLISEDYLEHSYEKGKLYSLTKYGSVLQMQGKYKGLVYVPDEINSDTSFVQYYAGGAGLEDYLWYSGVYMYFEQYHPNAVIVFTNESGTTHIETRNRIQWGVLQQIAAELGIAVYDLSVIASSAGCYTAMQLCYDYYYNYGISVRRCITLDTGCYWTLDGFALSKEQCEVLAAAGTEFWLFEEELFEYDLQKNAVQNILQSGMKCTAVICRHGNHSVISQNAYRFGVFSFCAGEDISLPDSEYCIKELDSATDTLGIVQWSEKAG